MAGWHQRILPLSFETQTPRRNFGAVCAQEYTDSAMNEGGEIIKSVLEGK
jgi:hypothetical protein